MRASVLVASCALLACDRQSPAPPVPAWPPASDLAALVAAGWQLLEESGDHDAGEALRRFAAARLAGADDPLVLAGEGIARVMGGDAAGGEPLLRTALAHAEWQEPRNRRALAHYALGNLLFDGGRGGEAEAEYRAAADGATTGVARATALAQVATIALEGERLDAAGSALDAALSACPESCKVHYVRAQWLRRHGEEEQAGREIRLHSLLREVEEATRRRPLDGERLLRARRELAQAWPECEAVQLALIRVELEARLYVQARREAASLLEAKGASAPLAFLLARAHAGLGDLADATKARALARRLDPSAPPDLDDEIIAEWRRGQVRFTEEAAATLRNGWRRADPQGGSRR